jgi:hypothetical protein
MEVSSVNVMQTVTSDLEEEQCDRSIKTSMKRFSHMISITDEKKKEKDIQPHI